MMIIKRALATIWIKELPRQRAYAQLTVELIRRDYSKLNDNLGVAMAIQPPVAGFAAVKTVGRRESVRDQSSREILEESYCF